MSKKFREWDIDQMWLLPPSVRELVPEGHAAHFVRELVRTDLDLRTILDSYQEERGFPPYHPVMMTALLLYTYSQGIYSSRKIARACQERVDYMAVTALQKPDFRTISDFRKRHLDALGGLFVQVLRLCGRAGLVKLGHVALDGTKIQANASKHKAMSYGRMRSEEKRLEEEVKGWLEKAAQIDAEEDERYGSDRRGDELPDWVSNKQKRQEKIREAREALEREAHEEAERLKGVEDEKLGSHERQLKRRSEPENKSQRNFTDPDSRVMRDKGTYVQAYNCQAGVDAASQVIVTRSLSNRQNDARELPGLLRQIRENMGRQAAEVSADANYCSEANLKELNRRHIRGYVATGRHKHGQSGPAAGRQSESPWIRAMTARLRRGGFASRYRLRKKTVEPVFGQIKSAMGFTRFLLRGLAKVEQEWSLVCTALNLRKLIAATG